MESSRTYRAIWRWHFHAGLFCIPFIVVLAITGSIYLFKPQIEAFADRDVNHLELRGPAAPPSAQLAAAKTALPGARWTAYEMPVKPDAAVRIHLRADDGSNQIAYVDPASLAVLKVVERDSRLTEVVKSIHGELMIGKTGSVIVELAACWAIVMIVTGLYLWWPRNAAGLAGVVYPRVRAGRATFWRDLHAVSGVWISSLVLFILVSGLPWTTVWGAALKEIRAMAAGAEVRQDWTTAGVTRPDMGGDHAGHGGHASSAALEDTAFSLDAVVPMVAALEIAPPVMVQPPTAEKPVWSVRGNSQNRPLRRELSIGAHTGEIVHDEPFAERKVMDRVIGIGIAAHEGQLFGWANQMLALVATTGLVTLCVSALVLWWRKRPEGALGVPAPKVRAFRVERGMAVLIVALGVLLPVFGASLLVVALLDRWVLRGVLERRVRASQPS